MTRRSLPPKLLVLGLSAVFVLAGCGGESTSSDSLPPPDATASDSGDDDGGLRAPTPIEMTGGGSGGAGAPGGTKVASPEAASDMSMPYYSSIEYVLGEVGELPTNTTGYVFPAGATPSADQIAQIAAALGVVGEVVEAAVDIGGGWQVGPTDGSAPSLYVSPDAQLTWWYNSAWGTITASPMDCAVSSDGTESCREPEPPVGVPTAGEAESKARELMVALGENPDSLTFDVTADEWFAGVEIVAPIDGVQSPVRWSFGFGENGTLQYASGLIARPEPVGPYPLIDLDTAFARLRDQGSVWLGGWGSLADVGVARSGVATAEPSVGSPGVASGVAGEGEIAATPPAPTPEPLPGEAPVASVEPLPVPDSLPVPESPPVPETLVITLVDVEADLWWAWDADGAVWMLPAYRFIGDDGGWYTVPAVTDEFLIIVEPDPNLVPEPLPLPEPLPVPGETVPGEPALFDTAPLEPSVGKSLADFTADAEALGATVRVVEQDGVGLAMTYDFVFSRVNVAVEGDVVTHIVSVG